jgi:hypothetical protein
VINPSDQSQCDQTFGDYLLASVRKGKMLKQDSAKGVLQGLSEGVMQGRFA